MDERVVKAMLKWPDVPAVYGWLSLDRRGQWLIKGERIANPLVSAFIGRNYESDSRGRWYFQNGPQRVYVRLEYTPHVYFVQRVGNDVAFAAHTGTMATRVREALVDESGSLLLETELGVGLVCDRDLPAAAEMLLTASGRAIDDDALEGLRSGDSEGRVQVVFGALRVPVSAVASGELERRFAFQGDPRPMPGEPDC